MIDLSAKLNTSTRAPLYIEVDGNHLQLDEQRSVIVGERFVAVRAFNGDSHFHSLYERISDWLQPYKPEDSDYSEVRADLLPISDTLRLAIEERRRLSYGWEWIIENGIPIAKQSSLIALKADLAREAAERPVKAKKERKAPSLKGKPDVGDVWQREAKDHFQWLCVAMDGDQATMRQLNSSVQDTFTVGWQWARHWSYMRKATEQEANLESKVSVK